MEGIFVQARKAGPRHGCAGDQLRARKEELLADYNAAGLPKPETTTLTSTRV